MLVLLSRSLWALDSSGYELLNQEQKRLQLLALESEEIRGEAARLLENEIGYLESKNDYKERSDYYSQRIDLIKDHLVTGGAEAHFDWDERSWEDLRIRKLLDSWLDIVYRDDLIRARKEMLKSCLFTGLTRREVQRLQSNSWFSDPVLDVLKAISPRNLYNRKKLMGRVLDEWSGSGLDIHLLYQFYEQIWSLVSGLDDSDVLWLLGVMINQKGLQTGDPVQLEIRVYDYWISLLESRDIRRVLNEISRVREILQITGRFPELIRILDNLLESYNLIVKNSSLLEKNIMRRLQLISIRNQEEEVPRNQFLRSPYSSEEIMLLKELMDILYLGKPSFFRYLIHSSSTGPFTELMEDFLSLAEQEKLTLFGMLGISKIKGLLIQDIVQSFYKPELSLYPEWKQLLLQETL